MPRPKTDPSLPPIHTIRSQRVVLDSDLAALYEVPTFRLNEAIKRNADRFPEDFRFQLTPDEVANLISQFAISSSDLPERQGDPSNSSQFAMSSRKHRGATYRPWAFTENVVLQDVVEKLLPLLNPPPEPPKRRIGFVQGED